METLKSLNPLQEKSTTQSVIDSVKSINPLQEKSNTEKVMEKFSFTSNNQVEPLSIRSVNGGSWMTRFFLLIIIVILMIITFGAYLVKGKTEGSETLRSVFSKGGGVLMNTIEETFNKFIEGTRFSGGVLAGSVISVINLFKTMFSSLDYEEKVYVKQKSKKKKEKKGEKSKMEKEVMNKKKSDKKAEPDNMNSSIQEKKKPGFCYVGYQAPHNACIQLDDVKKCMSGKVFNTMDDCVNYKPI
jgi:hypothetical protein